MKSARKKLTTAVLIGAALLGTIWMVNAQDFPMFRGTATRDGLQRNGISDPTPGRMRLNWWDPTGLVSSDVDNWEPGTSASPGWKAPGDGSFAANYTDKEPVGGRPKYLFEYITPARSVENFWQAADSSKESTFEWRFPTSPGAEYALFVNIPVGPTTVIGGPLGAGTHNYFSSDYYVYEVVGIRDANGNSTEFRDIVTNARVGGEFRLGEGGNETSQVFTAAGNQITIRLINTMPLRAPGLPYEDDKDLIVYADSARASTGYSIAGNYVASPIVGELSDSANLYPFRVYAGRNESTTAQVGSETLNTTMVSLSSFRHNGLKVEPTETGNGGTFRRNVIWSWPVQRPFSGNEAAVEAYNRDKVDWLNGVDLAEPINRAKQSITVDTAGIGFQASAGFVRKTDLPDQKGTDYFEAPLVQGGVPSAAATFEMLTPPGKYTIEVWCPGDDRFGKRVRVQAFRDDFPLGVTYVNMGGQKGWARLVFRGLTEFDSSYDAPISVAISNATDSADDAGKFAYADMVRVTRTADLSMKSTPAFARNVPVNDNGNIVNRDVVIAALENGRIYCLDAEGFFAGGNNTGTTKVYWTYPSERNEGKDASHVDGQNGKDGIAMNPTSFGRSSPLIQRVRNGTVDEWRVMIASQNGLVFSLSATGNGDGTTVRRWTWPNDYPSSTLGTMNIGAGESSVTYGKAASGVGAPIESVFVTTQEGRVFALDAAGDATSRTTTSLWTFPKPSDATAGSTSMTPAYAEIAGENRLYYGAGAKFYSIKTTDTDNDGAADLAWESNGSGGDAAEFGNFGHASPLVASSSVIGGGMPDTVYLANSNRGVYALDAANGNVIYSAEVLNSSPSTGPAFSYRNNVTIAGADEYNPLLPQPGTPVIIVPTVGGTFEGVYARVNDLGRNNSRKVFSQTMSAKSQIISGIAFGGKENGQPAHITDTRFDEEYSRMYAADDQGLLAAFGDDPDLPDDVFAVSPGTPPIDPPSENNFDVDGFLKKYFVDAASKVRFVRITPAEYDALIKAFSVSGSVAKSEVDKAFTSKVSRSAFDFGESLYVMLYKMPAPDAEGATVNYRVTVQFATPGRSTVARNLTVTTVTGASQDESRVGLAQFPLQPSGGNSLLPGKGKFSIKITANFTTGGTGGQAGRPVSGTVDLNEALADPAQALEATLCHPFGIAKTSRPVLNSASPSSQAGIYDRPQEVPELTSNGNANAGQMVQPYGTTLNAISDSLTQIPHGTTAKSVMYVYDRSLMVLLNGPTRGLQGVRAQTRDLHWNILNAYGNNGWTYKPLYLDQRYRSFEDAPSRLFGLNQSFDYPDIRREYMTITRNLTGESQNPTFQQVSLVAPTYTEGDFTAYRTTAYGNTLPRTLRETEFNYSLDVPKYQPPTTRPTTFAGQRGPGYISPQAIYIDGNNVTGIQRDQEVYREFTSSATVAADERLVVGTPEVDLGAIPAGGGYGPGDPKSNNRLFNMFGRTNDPLPRTFSVLNDGNVNMLNVRIAKLLDNEPFQLYSKGQNNAAWLNATDNLHSEIDLYWSNINGGGNRKILQKPRVGDTIPTRLRQNPVPRGNPNIGTVSPGALEPDDPRVAVSVPIGTPSGQYESEVFVIEDDWSTTTDPTDANLNRVGANRQYEPFSDPGLRLKFAVRETRLTTRTTPKTVGMIDAFNFNFDDKYFWANQDPSMFRDGNGTLVVAMSSNRNNAGKPEFIPSRRNQDDSSDNFHLFFSTLQGSQPKTSGYPNPLNDLTGFVADGGKWFKYSVGPYPNVDPNGLFGLLPGQKLDPRTVRYGKPSFSSNSVLNPFGDLNSRVGSTTYVAFVGEATRTTADGATPIAESRLFLAEVTTSQNGGVNVSAPIPLGFKDENGQFVPADVQGRFGKPSVTNVGNQVTVWYPLTTGGLTQLYWANFDGNRREWTRVGGPIATGNLRLGSSFESVGSVSTALRRQVGTERQQRRGVMTMAFTGKMRGRANSDVYLASVNTNEFGTPSFLPGTRSVLIPWETRTDPVETSETTSIYWSFGSDFLDNDSDIQVDETLANQLKTATYASPLTSGTFIDIMRVTNNGQYQSILDHTRASKSYDQASRTMTIGTRYGGQAIIDLATGSVRFTGSMLPVNLRLIFRYTPRFVRISEGGAANYRGASLIFDDRPISETNYASANGGQFNNGPLNSLRPEDTSPLDRYYLAYLRTSTEGTEPSAPYMRTVRYGIKLPTAVALNSQGLIKSLSATVSGGNSFYQVDPVKGIVYLTADQVGSRVRVNYMGRSGSAEQLVSYEANVGLIGESREFKVPMEQGLAESAVTLSLDSAAPQFFRPFDIRRPGLVWMLWTSQRAGTPDIYMQTIAPKLIPDPPSTSR